MTQGTADPSRSLGRPEGSRHPERSERSGVLFGHGFGSFHERPPPRCTFTRRRVVAVTAVFKPDPTSNGAAATAEHAIATDDDAPRSDLYSIPELSPNQERLTRAIAVMAWCFGLYWIAWRWSASLNWDAPVFSLALVL